MLFIAFKELSVKKALRTDPYTDLDKDAKEFIQYYCKKWRAKTIFQVLLQYRAVRYQDLFNFSQQVHLYNQNAINHLQQIDIEVNLNSIDDKAKYSTWIGDPKPTVLKLPFRLDEIPYYDTSYLGDPSKHTEYVNKTLNSKSVITVFPFCSDSNVEESWDFPFQWHNTDSVEIPNNNISSALPELPYTRDPADELPKLPQTPEPPPKTNKQLVTAKNIRNKLPSDDNTETDKDFEFIRPPPIALKRRKVPDDVVNPVAELKRLGRRESGQLNEDEPPFNFQKMLRKTNFQRASFKRVTVDNEKEKEQDVKEESGVAVANGEVEEMSNGTEKSSEEIFSGEILPGVFLEGIVISL